MLSKNHGLLRNYLRLRFVLLTSCFALALNGQTLKEIKSEGGARPLNEALEQIEDFFKAPVFYEEIAHENPADLVSGSELGMNPNLRYLRLRNLDIPITQPPSLESAIADVLGTYHGSGLPGTYKTILLHNDIVAILPQTMMNKAGSTITVVPLLETNITLPAISRTRAETLEAIIDAMNVVSKRRINRLPLDPDVTRIVFGADHEPSGSVLSRLEEEFGPFTCHILYDPPTDQYYANFRWLPKPQPAIKPALLKPNSWFTPSK